MSPSMHDLLPRLEASGSEARRRLLDAVRAEAQEHGLAAYLVGGSVRDLLIGRESPDRDIVIEGDAIGLAREIARRLGAPAPVTHEAFGTATVAIGGEHVDLTTARREQYPKPGALPVVTPSQLADDLGRRDFTINAMALGLAGARRGELVDPHRGLADLEAGVVRTLHDRSFQDDATRLLRAVRYAARFRFRIDEQTEVAARRDRLYLHTISPARVRGEMERTFGERRPVRALQEMQRLDLPDALVAGLRFTDGAFAAWRRLTAEEWEEMILAWLPPVLRWREAELERYVERFALNRAEVRAVRALPEAHDALTELTRAPVSPSVIAARLDAVPLPATRIWAYAAPKDVRGRLAARYLELIRPVRPRLSAAELRALGVPEGPLFGAVLRELRAARLDEPALTLDDERRLVQHRLEEQPGA